MFLLTGLHNSQKWLCKPQHSSFQNICFSHSFTEFGLIVPVHAYGISRVELDNRSSWSNSCNSILIYIRNVYILL